MDDDGLETSVLIVVVHILDRRGGIQAGEKGSGVNHALLRRRLEASDLGQRQVRHCRTPWLARRPAASRGASELDVFGIRAAVGQVQPEAARTRLPVSE